MIASDKQIKYINFLLDRLTNIDEDIIINIKTKMNQVENDGDVLDFKVASNFIKTLLNKIKEIKIYNIGMESIKEKRKMITKFNEFIKENSEFNQYNMDGGNLGASTFGTPGWGFASDPSLSIYSDDNRPYADYYSRSAGATNKLMQIGQRSAKDLFNDPRFNKRSDIFLEDSTEYKKMKIQRIVQNENLKLDIYVSFEFNKEEFFGCFKNFNGLIKPPTFTCPELLNESRYPYIDREYYLKLNNFFYKKLVKWFKPEPGLYINLKENNSIKDEMGRPYFLKRGKIVEVLGHNEDENNEMYVAIKINGHDFYVEKNHYYWFNWRFEPANKKKEE